MFNLPTKIEVPGFTRSKDTREKTKLIWDAVDHYIKVVGNVTV